MTAHSLINIQLKKKQQKQRENIDEKQCKEYNHCHLGLHKSLPFPPIYRSPPFLKSRVLIFLVSLDFKFEDICVYLNEILYIFKFFYKNWHFRNYKLIFLLYLINTQHNHAVQIGFRSRRTRERSSSSTIGPRHSLSNVAVTFKHPISKDQVMRRRDSLLVISHQLLRFVCWTPKWSLVCYLILTAGLVFQLIRRLHFHYI